MWEQGVDAVFILRGFEDELGFAVFLGNGVVVAYGHGAVRIAVCSHSDPEYREIDGIGQDGDPGNKDDDPQKDSPQMLPQVWFTGFRHEARL